MPSLQAVETWKDQVYATVDGNELKLDLFVPSVAQTPKLLVWIHGGGWRGGSKSSVPLKPLLEDGYAIASVEYRFTDEALFPAQIHDCKGAIRWLRKHAERFGYSADWIAVAGGSAGGHLALLVGTSAGVDELEGNTGGNLDQSSSVDAVIDYYGPSDFVLRGKTQPDRAYTQKSGSFALLGGLKDGKVKPEMEAFASPVTYVDESDPPLLVFHGTNDKTVLLDQSERIHSLYHQTGLSSTLVVLEGAGHGGKRFFQPEQIEVVLKFLRQHAPSTPNSK